MTDTSIRRAVALLGAVVASAGMVDSVRGGQGDLAVLFAVVLAAFVVLVAARARRPLVPLRADLVRWAEQRAAITGEPLGRILDRAVDEHRERVAGAAAEAPDKLPAGDGSP